MILEYVSFLKSYLPTIDKVLKIKYSRKALLVCALLLFFAAPCNALDVTLAWDANIEPDLAGYKLYHKTGSAGLPYNSPITVGIGNPNEPFTPDYLLNDPNNPEFTFSGLSDNEIHIFVVTAYNTRNLESGYSNEVSTDEDGDGMADHWENTYFGELTHDGNADGDGDGLDDRGEFQNKTDPTNWDTDSDLMRDGWEVTYGLDPLIDDASGDPDQDGLSNLQEYNEGRHPTNCEPDTPVLLLPRDGELNVPLTARLETDPFNDFSDCVYPDDSHAETEWQISNSADFSAGTLVLHVKSNLALTSLIVPDFILSTNTNYYWRVKFHDDGNASSAWSDPISFTTLTADDSDHNGDGVPDDHECDASVDLDGNGVPDISQDDIKCVKSLGGAGEIGVKFGPNVSIDKIKPINPNEIAHIQGEVDNFPLGLVSFIVAVSGAGDQVSMTVYFSKTFPSGAKYYKYDPVYGLREYQHATFGTTAAGNSYITLQLRDGDRNLGDIDGLENTFIVDPGGVGIASTPSSSSGGGGGGGGGGCFIGTAAFGLNMEGYVQILLEFRDNRLLTNQLGSRFVEIYYQLSPPVADYLRRHPMAKSAVRYALIPITGLVYVALIIHPLVLITVTAFLILVTALCYRRRLLKFRR